MTHQERVSPNPRIREEVAASPPAEPALLAPIPTTGGELREVLVVDDESVLRQVLAEAIGDRYGCKVFEAADGVEAIEVFQVHGSDIGLVLMDCVMPRLRGPEAFDAMRRIQPEVMGILMSGFSDEISQELVLRHGFAALLKKPFPFKMLADLLADLRFGSGGARSTQGPPSQGPSDT